MTRAELDKLRDALASTDAKAAYQAIGTLAAAAPGQSVPFLGEKLKPVAAPDPKLVAELIADLGSEDFAARQKATGALEKPAELATPELRAALGKASLETARRINRVLDSLARQTLPSEKLRDLRAVEALTGRREGPDGTNG